MCQIIDVACPGNNGVERKEDEKVRKYRYLAVKIKALWKMKMEELYQKGSKGTSRKLELEWRYIGAKDSVLGNCESLR